MSCFNSKGDQTYLTFAHFYDCCGSYTNAAYVQWIMWMDKAIISIMHSIIVFKTSEQVISTSLQLFRHLAMMVSGQKRLVLFISQSTYETWTNLWTRHCHDSIARYVIPSIYMHISQLYIKRWHFYIKVSWAYTFRHIGKICYVYFKVLPSC